MTLKSKFSVLATGLVLASTVSFQSHAAQDHGTTKAARVQQNLNPAPKASLPKMNNGRWQRGDEAVQSLRAKGATRRLAQYHGLSDQALEAVFLGDPLAVLDQDGMLLYTEPLKVESSTNPTDPQISNFSPEQTFQLESKPGAPRTIYLDFNGHVTQNSAWNTSYGLPTISSPAFSSDANAAFSSSELAAIQTAWRIVAEDYAAFDVNVTTKEPTADRLTRSSSTDTTYGVRVVVTNDFTKATTSACGCGGFAYVGVFSRTDETYKPAFVFADNLGFSAKNIAEAISHEAGHTLGLQHDGNASAGYYTGHGTGETGWAPIMGVGYSKSLVQWSKGEYAGANQLQDDYLVMQNNGLPFAADVVGNTLAQAYRLTPTQSGALLNYAASSVIEGPGDVDFYRFSAGVGQASVQVLPYATSPNLDVLLSVFDSAGNLLGQVNPSEQLASAASLSILTAGEYVLSVQGTGKGDPLGTGYTKYGSIGRYSVAITAPSTIAVNTPPIAQFSVSAASFVAPATISFDGSSSSDAEGAIAQYSWQFSDGTVANGPIVSKVFNQPGTYTASLTVADAQGLTNSLSKTVTVEQPAVAPVLSVGGLTAQIFTTNKGKYTTVSVRVKDAAGNPVPGALVVGRFSGILSSTGSATTGIDGVARITSATTRKFGNLTFAVSSVAKSGSTYDSTKNSSSSITVRF